MCIDHEDFSFFNKTLLEFDETIKNGFGLLDIIKKWIPEFVEESIGKFPKVVNAIFCH